MDSNYFAHYLAHQAEYPIRLQQSQRFRDAEDVAASRPKRQFTHPVRGWMSALLIAAGERMQEKITLEPTHAESIR
jgi:hypothetical protein